MNEEHAEFARGGRRAPIEFLRPNPRNPRKLFDDGELDELAASIKERGVIQPIVVRAIPSAADTYEIIAGERRWRAAQRAGLHDIPVIVVEAGDREALEIAIVENVQRADLNALEGIVRPIPRTVFCCGSFRPWATRSDISTARQR